MSNANDRFITLASEVVAELESAITRNDTQYYNAEIALRNVQNWLALAKSGTLKGTYSPNFGISRSDLMFGPVEERMYELERIYTEEILKFSPNAI